MNTKLKIGLISLVLALLMILATTTYEGFIVKDNKQEIIVGFIGPLSGFGTIWGFEQQNAMRLAVDEINDAGGINGKKLNVVYEDGKCEGKEAVTAAQKLIQVDKVKIITTICSSSSLAIAPVAEENKVLQMAIWTTNPALTNSGDYVFRQSYSDADIAKAMANSLSNYNEVGLITEINDYSIGIRNAFEKNFEGKIIEESVEPISKDIRAQVAKVLAENPKAILVNPNSVTTGLEILDQLKELGYTGKIYGNYFGDSDEVQSSSSAQGMIFFADPVIPDNPVANHLFSEYEARYNKSPDFQFAVAAQYDAVYVLKQAIESSGEDPTKIKEYLHKKNSFTGALGTYYYDLKGDLIGLKPVIKQIQNEKAILI